MMERFEALAERFLALAEGTEQTANSQPEKKAQYALAAANCVMAAQALRAQPLIFGFNSEGVPFVD